MSATPHGLAFELDEAHRRALRFCTYCPKLCRFACPVAHGEARETSTPWGLMRLLNLLDQDMVEPDQSLVEALYHCMSCGRCQSYCRHDNPVAEILAKGRAALITGGFQVPDAFVVPAGGCKPVVAAPTRPIALENVPVFLPSCAHLADEAEVTRLTRALDTLEACGLPLSMPERATQVGCGFHEWEVGLVGEAQRSHREWRSVGQGHATAVTDCAPSLWAFGDDQLTTLAKPLHLIEWLAQNLDHLPTGKLGDNVVIHDACFPTRRLGLGASYRTVVAHLAGAPPRQLFEHGDQARCCGAEGQWANANPGAQAVAAKTVADDIRDSQPDWIVTSSPSCRQSLRRSLAIGDDRSDTVLDLLDLIILARS